jgi:hypothetical protein
VHEVIEIGAKRLPRDGQHRVVPLLLGVLTRGFGLREACIHKAEHTCSASQISRGRCRRLHARAVAPTRHPPLETAFSLLRTSLKNAVAIMRQQRQRSAEGWLSVRALIIASCDNARKL